MCEHRGARRWRHDIINLPPQPPSLIEHYQRWSSLLRVAFALPEVRKLFEEVDMVVTRRKPVVPAPGPASRTSSTQAVPQTSKPKGTQSVLANSSAPEHANGSEVSGALCEQRMLTKWSCAEASQESKVTSAQREEKEEKGPFTLDISSQYSPHFDDNIRDPRMSGLPVIYLGYVALSHSFTSFYYTAQPSDNTVPCHYIPSTSSINLQDSPHDTQQARFASTNICYRTVVLSGFSSRLPRRTLPCVCPIYDVGFLLLRDKTGPRV